MDNTGHIILVIADSLRYDTVWGGGHSRLNFLQSRSTTFHNAYSAGCWTLPSTASIFTGLSPHEHGSTTRTRGLDSSIPTLAQHLKEQGYTTVQLTANTVTTHIFGLDRGFDRIEPIWRFINPTKNPLGNFIVLFGKRRIRKKLLNGDLLTGRMTEDLRASQSWIRSLGNYQLDRAFRVLEEADREQRKVFLFINLMETHFPYHIDNKFRLRSRSVQDKYNEMKSLFHLVNQSWLSSERQHFQINFLRLLRNRQKIAWRRLSRFIDIFSEVIITKYPESLLVFTSDHGDNFGDEGWNYHFGNVTEAGNRVPLFVAGPNIPANREIKQPVSIRNLFQLVRNAAGRPPHLADLGLESDQPPVLESFWYDKNGQTLAQFREDKFAFVHDGNRYIMRGNRWRKSALGVRDSALVSSEDIDGDPIYDLPLYPENRKILIEQFDGFQRFSRSI